MKVGILGSGKVGQNLAKAFSETGHETMIGTRNPRQDEVIDMVHDLGHKIKLGTFADTANFGELIVFAINWAGVKNAIKLAGYNNFKNKVVIDTTNPLDMSSDMVKLDVSGDTSAGEIVQNLLSNAKVVKALNIVSANDMYKPNSEEIQSMFIAGNDIEAKKLVSNLINDFGWSEVFDLGNIENSRYLESLLMVRIAFAMKNYNWKFPVLNL